MYSVSVCGRASLSSAGRPDASASRDVFVQTGASSRSPLSTERDGYVRANFMHH